MDAFFAAIEERDNPRFKGMPLVVGADPADGAGRGVVSTANYPARAYGIRSAMPISKAWQLSEAARRKGLPRVAFLEVNMAKYAEVSHRIMETLRRRVEHTEQASVDEAYFDVSFLGDYEKERQLAREIKNEIKDNERLTASIGIGPNKLIAKIASDSQKPDGLTVVPEAEAEQFIEPMGIRVIPGVGPKSEEKLARLGVRTVRDAKKFSSEELHDVFGKFGPELYEKLRGRSDAPLVEEWEVKSVGEQTTFEHDVPAGTTLTDRKFLERTLSDIAADVHRRFLREQADGASFKMFKTIAITVRFNDFTTKARSVTLSTPDSRLETIQFQALRLFMPFLDRRENPGHKAIRLLGVRIEKLE